MGKYLNLIIAIVILLIVTAVCSNFFYRKGQENAWSLAKQLVPLEKGEIYLCVERTDVNGFSFLSTREINQAIEDKDSDLQDLKSRLSLALSAIKREEYNEKIHRR